MRELDGDDDDVDDVDGDVDDDVDADGVDEVEILTTRYGRLLLCINEQICASIVLTSICSLVIRFNPASNGPISFTFHSLNLIFTLLQALSIVRSLLLLLLMPTVALVDIPLFIALRKLRTSEVDDDIP